MVICGIDSVGKTTLVSQLDFKNTFKRKYPYDSDIKEQINQYYTRLIEGGDDLHAETIKGIYKQIHDLYDRDFRKPFSIPENTKLIILDRYFIDNIVYSRANGVERVVYSENHLLKPDLVIFLKARDYTSYKSKFMSKGDENIREPVILFEEVQPTFQMVIKNLYNDKKISKYTIIEGLKNDTLDKVKQSILDLFGTTGISDIV